MSWTKVLAVDALPPGGREVVKVGSRKILLLNHENQLYAVDNTCPHLKMPMKKGEITQDGAIVCPIHRSAFNMKTGAVQEWCPWPPVIGKALSMVSQPKTLPVFPVRVENGSIWVDM